MKISPLVITCERAPSMRSAARSIAVIDGKRFSGEPFSALSITLAMVTRGYGYVLPLSTFLLINVVVSLFGSLIPVPGGIGVMEAGLTAGLTRAGVDSDTAFAIALTHRFITFYLPPIWGFMSYQWLIKHRFL